MCCWSANEVQGNPAADVGVIEPRGHPLWYWEYNPHDICIIVTFAPIKNN